MGWFSDFISNPVEAVGNIGQSAINAVQDLGVSIDQTVRSALPGGWTEAALLAVGGYYAPEIGAWVDASGAPIAAQGSVPAAEGSLAAGGSSATESGGWFGSATTPAVATPVATGTVAETALPALDAVGLSGQPLATGLGGGTAAGTGTAFDAALAPAATGTGLTGTQAALGTTDSIYSLAPAAATDAATSAAMGGGTGLLASAAIPAAAEMGGAAGLTTAAAGGGILAETGVAGTGSAAATGGIGAGLATGVSGETGSLVAGTAADSATAAKAATTGAATTGAGAAAAAASPWDTVLTTALGGIITNALTGGGSAISSAISAADPFASQRAQYQAPLKEMMTGKFSSTDPSYAWRFGQGEQALERSIGAKGMLGSGNRLTALTDYGQGAASTEYQAQFNRLATLSGASSGSPGTAAQIGANAANANTLAAGTLASSIATPLVGWGQQLLKSATA